MSRVNKLGNKRAIVEAIRYTHDDKGNRTGRHKGPRKTQPKHEKNHRLPYMAGARKLATSS